MCTNVEDPCMDFLAAGPCPLDLVLKLESGYQCAQEQIASKDNKARAQIFPKDISQPSSKLELGENQRVN